ncbi:MAG: NAD(P)-dependent alcohol dehydrogenase [Bacteroidia bacterium]|nr:NAD(P)-dependent alcohol dehydrogenase [Bacteroidia bacterium]
MKKQKMKAITAIGYGSPEVLQLSEVECPQPKSNEVLVEVVAASVTTADTMMRTGKPYLSRLFMGFSKPKKPIPGTGFAGKIIAIGEDVSQFRIGEMVFGETAFGFSANAEYLVIPEDGVILPLPEGLEASKAASFCDGHLTSFNFLKGIAKLEAGKKVLINGASGALGTSAVQIAKHLGAHVTGVCSQRNAGLVKSLGADEVIDYTIEDFTDRRGEYDFIYDTVGKSSFKESKKALRPDGVYLSPVLKFPLLLQMIYTSLIGEQKAIFEATGTKPSEKLRSMLEEVVEIYKAGGLKTVIDRQFPLEKVVDAHRYIDSGRKRGNVVVVMG